MMTDYMLRTATAEDMDAALVDVGLAELVSEQGTFVVRMVPGAYLDRIGPIPAQLDPEGEIIKDGDPRYHANLRVRFELTEDQEAELPQVFPSPAVPYRVFA
jgi:hypothetical protein